jgi:hypothetical protein
MWSYLEKEVVEMLKRYGNILKVSLIVTLILLLQPGAVAAGPPRPGLVPGLLPGLPQAQEGEPFYMYSSYEWSKQSGPSRCPDPPIFKNGTRVVHNYIPAFLKQDVPVAVLWYELDENGNPKTEDPIAVGQAVLTAGSVPHSSLSFDQGAQGVFAAYLFVQDQSGQWIMLGVALYAIAPPGYSKVPEPGSCPLPETGGGGGGGGGSACSSEAGKGALEVVNYVNAEVTVDVSDKTGIIQTAKVAGVDTQPAGGHTCFQLAPGHYVIGANIPSQTAYTEVNVVADQVLVLSIR